MASLLSQLRGWVGSKFNSLASPANSVLGSLYSNVWAYGAREVYTAVNIQNYVDKWFSYNTAVYSITMKDADKFGSIPRYVYTKEEREEKASSAENELTTLLNRPNTEESQDVFFTKVRAYFKVCGEAFIWLNRGDITGYRDEQGNWDEKAISKIKPIEMICLPSQFVTPVRDKADAFGVAGYLLDLAGNKVQIPKSSIIHWKSTNLLFDATNGIHLRGWSPLAAGHTALDQNEAMTNAGVRQAQNDGARGVLYNESLAAMTPEQQTQLKSVIDRKINNNDVSGAIATLQGAWGYHDLGRSVRDLQILEGEELTWKKICFLLKVPYEFFQSETTYANKEQAQIAWITNDIYPACKQLDGELTRELSKAFGEFFIESDITDLPEIQKAAMETAKTMQEIWAISPDEIREFLGHEALGGDFGEPWVPTGRTPLSKSNVDDGGDDILKQIANERGGNTNGGNAALPKAGSRAGLRQDQKRPKIAAR